MNPFDILSRSLPRSVDTQFPRDTSLASEAADTSGMPSAMDSFDALLEGLSERPCREGESVQLLDGRDRLHRVMDVSPLDTATPGIGNAVFVLLEGLLPRVLPQVTPATSDGNAQLSDASSQLMFQEAQQLQENSDLLNSSVQPRIRVAVQHQETHFKPVVEAPVMEANHEEKGQLESAPEFISPDKLVGKVTKTAHPGHQNPTRDPLPQTVMAAVPEEQVEKQITAKDRSIGTIAERLDGRKNTFSNGVQSESTNPPPATLQRLASFVRTEIRSMVNEAAQHATATDQVAHVLSIKASDSALRLLNLQLHPADLGVVTIKMRLAGDSLEMELHTEKEETAQLLRHDSEKLSALLRGSGYRPDTIIIQVSDIAAQDRASTQRQQSDTQLQGQSFQQGGASQEGHSRDREKQYASTRAETPKDHAEERIPGSRNSGGVYL